MSAPERSLAELAKKLSVDIKSGANPVVLIDGRSGSGKTTQTLQLINEIFSRTQLKPQLVHMDDLYPGWEGLSAGARMLVSDILEPLSKGREAQYQKWNWATGKRGDESEPGNGWRTVAPQTPLIVEGCGSASQASRSLADYAIWIGASLEDRLSRLSSRDSERFSAFQELWRVQENDFYALEDTLTLCDYQIEN